MKTYGEIAAMTFNAGVWRVNLSAEDTLSREAVHRAGWEAAAQAVVDAERAAAKARDELKSL